MLGNLLVSQAEEDKLKNLLLPAGQSHSFRPHGSALHYLRHNVRSGQFRSLPPHAEDAVVREDSLNGHPFGRGKAVPPLQAVGPGGPGGDIESVHNAPLDGGHVANSHLGPSQGKARAVFHCRIHIIHRGFPRRYRSGNRHGAGRSCRGNVDYICAWKSLNTVIMSKLNSRDIPHYDIMKGSYFYPRTKIFPPENESEQEASDVFARFMRAALPRQRVSAYNLNSLQRLIIFENLVRDTPWSDGKSSWWKQAVVESKSLLDGQINRAFRGLSSQYQDGTLSGSTTCEIYSSLASSKVHSSSRYVAAIKSALEILER